MKLLPLALCIISLFTHVWSLSLFWKYDFISNPEIGYYSTLLWFASIVSWSFYILKRHHNRSIHDENERLNLREKYLFLFIVAFALVLRVYKINHFAVFLDDWYWLDHVRGILQRLITTPFGFIGDQPSNLPAFIVLPIYILTKKSYLAVRLTGILFSLSNVVIMFYLAKLFFNSTVAKFTIFLIATSLWDIYVSKIPWINTTINPVLMGSTLYYTYKSVTQYSLRNALFAGIFIGLSINLLYLAAINAIALLTYTTVLLIFLKNKNHLFKTITIITFTSFLVCAPTVIKILKYPEQSIGRHESFISSNVSLSTTHGNFMYYFSQFQSAFSRFFTHYAGYEGHIYPYWGITIEPIVQILFVIGIVCTILKWKETKNQMLLISFIAMFIPVVLLERGVSEWREYGFFNHIYLFAGLGSWIIYIQIQRIFGPRLITAKRVGYVLIMSLIIFFAWNVTTYQKNVLSKDMFLYESQCREIAEFIIKNADKTSTIYLPAEICTELISVRIWDRYSYTNFIDQSDLEFRLSQDKTKSIVVKLGNPFYQESSNLGDIDITAYPLVYYDRHILPKSQSIILIKNE